MYTLEELMNLPLEDLEKLEKRIKHYMFLIMNAKNARDEVNFTPIKRAEHLERAQSYAKQLN